VRFVKNRPQWPCVGNGCTWLIGALVPEDQGGTCALFPATAEMADVKPGSAPPATKITPKIRVDARARGPAQEPARFPHGQRKRLGMNWECEGADLRSGAPVPQRPGL